MPNPTINSVHIDRALTNISIAYKQSVGDFVSERVFPLIPTDKQSNKYFIYDRTYWNRSEVQKRAPGTESAGGGYKITTDNFYCDVWALHKDVADQIRANQDIPLNEDRDATEWLGQQFLITKEVEFASTYMTSGVWTSGVAGVAAAPGAGQVLQWNDAASTPIEDVRRAKTAVKLLTGYTPNVLTIGQQVYDALIDHADIIDRVKYGQTPGAPAMAGKDVLAKLFEVEEVVIASAIKNTGVEGAAESNSFIVGKVALLSYRPPRAGLLIPSAGYQFAWTGYLGAGAGAAQISKFRMEHLKADRIEGETAFDMKLVSADLGYFFNTIVS